MMLKLKLQYFGHLMRRADSFERPWCWERLRAGEGDDRGWDGWMASPTQWAWVWVDSGSWWWTGRPGVLWFMGSQRVEHDWVTELNWLISIWDETLWKHVKTLFFNQIINFSLTGWFSNLLISSILLAIKRKRRAFPSNIFTYSFLNILILVWSHLILC